jgi:hypothetical protein
MATRKNSQAHHLNIYFASGVIAAQANLREGFRPRDVRFYIELFTNWMNATRPPNLLELHNVQVTRYLEHLVASGHAQKGRGARPTFRLSRIGILFLMGEMTGAEGLLPMEDFFFVYCVVKSYGPLIAKLAEDERLRFPSGLRIELDELRDPQLLLKRQIRFAEKQRHRLELRAVEAMKSAQLARRLLSGGSSLEEVVAAVQEKFPYELNYEKALRDLFKEIPEERRTWELVEGAENRATELWEPQKKHWESYLRTLRGLER